MNRIPSVAVLRARKSIKKGLKFTIMLCGPGGCGKSTFINTLCGREVVSSLSKPVYDPVNATIEPGQEIEVVTEDLPDDHHGVLSIKFIDTPGFGDNIDNSICFEELCDYIERQFDEVLAEESRIKRNPKFTDNRVHALIYFILPTGHGLRETDVEFMKLMSSKVNIIPIISKADSLTPDELALNKKLIMDDIDHYNIPIYHFPFDSDSDDDAVIEQNKSLRALLPFAIIGGTDLIKVKGKSILARQYPWGYVDVEDEQTSDFAVLSDVLLRTHLLDLKDTTHDFLYENYRTEKLSRDVQEQQEQEQEQEQYQQHQELLQQQTNGTGPRRVPVPAIPETVSNRSAPYVIREEQLRVEEEKLRAVEQRVQDEIARKRQELLQREQELRDFERRLKEEASQLSSERGSEVGDLSEISYINSTGPAKPIAANY